MKIAIGITLSAAYMIANYFIRGYFNVASDVLVILLVLGVYFVFKDDYEKQDDTPVFVKLMRSVGSIRKM